jgi:predicted membrane protein
MSSVPQPPPPPTPPPPSRTGRLVAGLLLVIFGVGWLLETLDVGELPWEIVLPAALIVVGVVLLVRSRSAEHQGTLVTTGIVLTILLVLGSAVDVPIAGGVGERDERPTSLSGLRAEYRLGIGQLTLDLTGLPAFDGEARHVRARVGIGQLTVIVPEGTPVRVEARSGLGQVQVFDVEGSGFDVQRTTAPGAGVSPEFELVLTVGLGQVEVRRG